MQTLETELTYQNRTLRQLKRDGMIAIYEVRNAGELLYGYEVIKIKVLPEEKIFARHYPEREAYPSSSKESNDWGTIVWSFGPSQKHKALAMFNGLVHKANRPVKAEGTPK
jgi:hypothetical protein